jgi:hypothetical protein
MNVCMASVRKTRGTMKSKEIVTERWYNHEYTLSGFVNQNKRCTKIEMDDAKNQKRFMKVISGGTEPQLKKTFIC